MQTRTPPWHMWGETKNVKLIAKAVGVSVGGTQQLARLNYGRPESWSFLFVVDVVDGSGGSEAGLTVDFDLTVGIGRTSVTLKKFAHFFLQNAPIPHPFQWWTTAVRVPQDDSSLSALVWLVDEFPAQDIQCNANVLYSAAFPGDSVTLAISSYFSPKTHLRPEWALQEFPGGETQGK